MNPLTHDEIAKQYNDLKPDAGFTLCRSFSDGETHRGKRMMAVVGSDSFIFDNHSRCILTLQDEPGWLIVPSFYAAEAVVEDIGPFDTLAEAVVFLKLRAG